MTTFRINKELYTILEDIIAKEAQHIIVEHFDSKQPHVHGYIKEDKVDTFRKRITRHKDYDKSYSRLFVVSKLKKTEDEYLKYICREGSKLYKEKGDLEFEDYYGIYKSKKDVKKDGLMIDKIYRWVQDYPFPIKETDECMAAIIDFYRHAPGQGKGIPGKHILLYYLWEIIARQLDKKKTRHQVNQELVKNMFGGNVG